MERKTVISTRPDAILTSDWHLREDVPTCRKDNFEEAMWRKVDFISDLQRRYDCPVLHAGDLFHHWKPSPYLLSKTIEHLPKKFYTVLGQHDIPRHNLELAYKSGVYTLVSAEKVVLLEGYHFGQNPTGVSMSINGRSILVWHHLTYQSPPFPGASGGMAGGLLRKFKSFDLILTGDNHISFVEEFQGRLLVNPGSLMRQTADQMEHKPRVYLWFGKENKVQPVFIPIEEGVISREHIEEVEKRNERIEAFISRLDSDWQAEMSFEDNLRIFFEANKVHERVKEIIYKSIENEKV